MKKILWLTFIFVLLFVGHSFADYTLSVVPKGVNITATLSGVPSGRDIYKLVLQTDNFDATNTYSGKTPSSVQIAGDSTLSQVTITPPQTTGSVKWTLVNLKANTTYYARVVDFPALGGTGKFITSAVLIKTGTISIPIQPLSTTLGEGGSITVSGKVNINSIPGFSASNFTAVLYYTETPVAASATSLPDGKGPLRSEDSNGKDGINDDGTYYWHINSLSPSTTYYIQQVVTLYGNSTSDTIDHFNSSTGNIIASSADQASYDAKHSYTLLSGFPDLTVLPDPDLCAQQRATAAASGTAGPKFCDMNDVINYFLSLLIALSAVSLVFRLMYEGYKYMTSDVPFLKASAKSGFFAALGGLLIAMTSYIILNTVNPKLVTNANIGPTTLAIGVTQPDEDTVPIINQGSISAPGGPIGACQVGLVKVTVQKSSFIACKSISSNLSLMLTAAYAQGITLEGGGFRTKNEQIALRTAHCNGDLTSPKAICKPPTAVPGHSNHESGLAFDFTCDNASNTIQTHDNKCYIWLSNNAANYGLKNFSKEPWHWSVDGR